MKSPLLAIAFSLITNFISAQVRYDVNFMFEGKQRECIIVKPSKAPPVGGYPIVFMLHGTAQDGEKFYDISGWKELGEKENFITVFPTSLKWCFVQDGLELYQTRWVNGNVTENPCSGPPQNYVDDIKFLKKLVSMIIDTLPVNSTKIFASGFSNGSAMIHKIAMDAGDVFAAVAGTSAPLSAGDSVIPPVHRIPIWFMLGNKDPKYINPPFTEVPFGGDSVLIYLRASISRALACQGLSGSHTKTETTITHTYTFNEEQLVPTASPYRFTLIKDMIHIYPNGVNFPLNAPVEFWDFFNNLPTIGVKQVAMSSAQISLFPNPSNDKIQVKINTENKAETFNLKIFNCFGQTLYMEDCKIDSDFFLDKKEIGLGLFIVQVQLGNRIACKKVIFN